MDVPAGWAMFILFKKKNILDAMEIISIKP